MYKRVLAVFSLIVLLFGLLIARISLLAVTEPLIEAAHQQSATVLKVAETRGMIYDRKLRPLTGIETDNIAAVLPNSQSADVLMRVTPIEKRAELQQKLTQMRPFLWEVDTTAIYAKGLEVFPVPKRYLDEQPAVHIIGQVDPATGQGASGLERAYDSLLTSAGGAVQMRYATDALQRGLETSPPEIMDSGYLSGAGLVLTLDRDIQEIAEKAAKNVESGAIIIMDPYTGDILAVVSAPAYNPNNPADAMTDNRTPFFNRAFAAYSVGSTFKLLTAATALESGFSAGRTYTCNGAIEVIDQLFRCHNLNGHGTLDMQGALNHSCNPYFISLALEVGGPALAYKAQQLGFGTRFEAAPGYFTAAGSLPTLQELVAPAAVANFGFGQGILSATPVQIATLVSAIANGGGAVTPRLVAGTTADGKAVTTATATYSPRSVFRETAAQQVKEMMIGVVEQGSGKNARPEQGGAGGKTASAQTGQYRDGQEIVHAWFSGFYPAEQPQYTIVVLAEGGDSGSDAACPIFKEIADGLYELGKNGSAKSK